MSNLSKMAVDYITPIANEIFNSENIGGSGKTVVEAIVNYPLQEVISHPLEFSERVQQMYAREKKRAIAGQQLPAGMDLTNPKDLRRMDSHIKVHVVTGLVEWEDPLLRVYLIGIVKL